MDPSKSTAGNRCLAISLERSAPYSEYPLSRAINEDALARAGLVLNGNSWTLWFVAIGFQSWSSFQTWQQYFTRNSSSIFSLREMFLHCLDKLHLNSSVVSGGRNLCPYFKSLAFFRFLTGVDPWPYLGVRMGLHRLPPLRHLMWSLFGQKVPRGQIKTWHLDI